MTRPLDYEQLVADYEQVVYAKILALVHDPQEAEDLTQETFLRVYRALPKFRGEASVKTWVLRIARNAVVDRYRRRAVRPDEQVAAKEAELEELPDAGQPSPALTAQQRRSGECIRETLDTLPESYRQAVELHDLDDLSNPEIAERLGLSLPTVKIRVHRGRRRLREACEQECESYQDERGEVACQPKSRSDS